MATEYGADVSTFPVLDVSGTNIDGTRAIIEVAIRRISTDAATLSYADATECFDIRTWLSKLTDTRGIAGLESRIENVIERDERVRQCDATVTFDRATEAIRVSIAITPFQGRTFKLAIAADKFTVSLLDA